MPSPASTGWGDALVVLRVKSDHVVQSTEKSGALPGLVRARMVRSRYSATLPAEVDFGVTIERLPEPAVNRRCDLPGVPTPGSYLDGC